MPYACGFHVTGTCKTARRWIEEFRTGECAAGVGPSRYQHLSARQQSCRVAGAGRLHVSRAGERAGCRTKDFCCRECSCRVCSACHEDLTSREPCCCMSAPRELHMPSSCEAAGNGKRRRQCQNRT